MKRLIQFMLSKLGYRIVRAQNTSTPSAELSAFFALLSRFGFAPKHVLDIGANHGNWTREAMEFFPDAQYTLVEPQDHLKLHVQDLVESGKRIAWINAGASDQSGVLPFTISYRDDASTFAWTEEQARTAGYRQITIPVKTVNQIVTSVGGPVPDMVKIDAEGLDLKVLVGSSELFGKTDIFLVEGVVCGSGYDNSVAKIIQFMSVAGYRLVDITHLNRSPKHGVLWLCELAFLRNASPLFDAASSYE
jgi:FkbM family methyltransferase